jgi:hypothetical protein
VSRTLRVPPGTVGRPYRWRRATVGSRAHECHYDAASLSALFQRLLSTVSIKSPTLASRPTALLTEDYLGGATRRHDARRWPC